MSNGVDSQIDLAELKHLLEAVEPGLVLTPPRTLRRIIKRHCKLPGFGLQVPHRKTYVIDRETLFRFADESDLELEPGRQLPETVVLVARPDPERLAGQPRDEVLVKYWRLLFHARVHIALEERTKAGRLGEHDIRERIHRIGETEFDEVRGVLLQEDFLLPPRDDRQAYIEFIALFVDLGEFAPNLLLRYFPGLREREDVHAIIAQDIDAPSLLAATRPHGAPDAEIAARRIALVCRPPAELKTQRDLCAPCSPRVHQQLLHKADRASARGNAVRAAILRRRAASVEEPAAAARALAAAHAELTQLVTRLRSALGLSEATAAEWHHALLPLLERGCQGLWPMEGRLLYDLQKVCTEHERETYALDIVGWIVSLGKLPVKRVLPNHRAVLIAKHLRSAMRRLPAARIPERGRRTLAHLLLEAVEQSEHHLRERLRPLLVQTLDRVKLEAQNYPEQVARNKLVEELLDLVVERGFVTMGNLRDTISRNNVKLPDLANADEFFLGDRLIRTNRRLAVAWDGVYHRAEIYLRWLQRLSSLAFATRAGRALTRYLVMPYGVAYVSLEGILHLQHLFARLTGSGRIHLHKNGTAIAVVVLGTFLFALMHSTRFRSGTLRALAGAAQVFRVIFIAGPAYLLGLPVVRKVLESDGFEVFRNLVLKPLGVTALTAVVYPLYGARPHTAFSGMGVTFFMACLVLNTRVGHILEESITDAMMKTWLRFRLDVFPALFAFTMSLFRGLVEAVERLIYTVDEWLRFRTGQSRLTLIAKTVLGFFWFFVTYLVRIYVNLFIEPTVNPIKHFPVVTVSAKLILPFYSVLLPLMEAPFLPLGPAVAKSFAWLNFVLLPGIFGFIVWELKENWRLYRANRSNALRPVIIGHHGETMSRLLRPGFHSGTVPSLYRKLRRAERRAYRSGEHAATHKHREALHHIEERIRHFVEREFVELLRGSKNWAHAPLSADKISISSNRIAIEFESALGSGEPVSIAFEERCGWLVASHTKSGWLGTLAPSQLAAWNVALAGLYKLAAVDSIREPVEASFPDTILWCRWVEIWEADQAGKNIVDIAGNAPRVVPDQSKSLLVGAKTIDNHPRDQ